MACARVSSNKISCYAGLALPLPLILEFVEHVGGLVDPTAPWASFGTSLVERTPQPVRTASGCQQGAPVQAARLQVAQYFKPRCRRLAQGTANPYPFVGACGGDEHYDQQAASSVRRLHHASRYKFRQPTSRCRGSCSSRGLSTPRIDRPTRFQPVDHVRREHAHLDTPAPSRSRAHIATGNPLQVQPLQCRSDRLRAMLVLRRNGGIRLDAGAGVVPHPSAGEPQSIRLPSGPHAAADPRSAPPPSPTKVSERWRTHPGIPASQG